VRLYSRGLVASALSAALTVGLAAAAVPAARAAGGGGSTSTEAALQVQAQELAGEIEADGRNLDRIAEALDAAQIRSQQLTAHLGALRATVARTTAQVTVARTALREQAVISYVAGGAALTTNVPDRLGSDPSVTVSYAEIVAGGQRRAVAAYRAVLALQTRESKQVALASAQAAQTVVELRSDRAAAAAALATRQAALGQVQGQLTVLVAQVEAAQEQAARAAVQATLARQDQPPPPAMAVASAGPPVAASRARPVRLAAAPTAAAGSAATTGVSAASTATRPTSAPAPTRPVPRSTTAPRQTAAPDPAPAPTTPRPPSTPQPTAPRPRATPAPTTARTVRTAPPPTSPPTTAKPRPPPAPPVSNAPTPGWATALHYAYAQLGKPYQWGGAGPRSFDCSGLTMMAWAAAGVYLPHLAQAQYNMAARIPLGRVLPGDLIFFGTPSNVYHVGIYIGGGEMIDAPSTGLTVSISSIYWADLLGAGRIRG
jgi:peptidoglycan DL-endopeptidase CwlO